MVKRAQENVDRLKTLVADGAVAPEVLLEAEDRLADAQDQEVLSQTLYTNGKVEDTTPEQAAAMLAAAERRVDRAAKIVEARHKLLDMGIISQAEMAGVKSELTSRELVLDLARNRMKLLDELRQMAAQEKLLETPTVQNSMIRYNGSAPFQLTELPAIEKAYKAHFNQDLPISAIGETAVHQSLGLDHRNRVDVALNPEQPRGLWLRSYLEKQHLPYLAFRHAVAGAATAPHIHIGAESSRLH